VFARDTTQAMFLSKAEATLKGLISPVGHHRLNRMIREGFPAGLLEPLKFLLTGNAGETERLTVEKIERIRSEISQKQKEYAVVHSSGDSDRVSIVDRRLGWLVEVASITKYWGTFLHLCANAIQADTILELGSCVGISSCYLASAKSCKNFITIEGSNTLIPAIESNLRKITNHFKIVNALFDAGLDQILPSLKSGIDLVFIDGDHTKAATLRYFNRITPFLNCGSVVLFDDIHWSREMWETWQMISESRGLVFTVNLGRIGFCIWNGQEEKPRNYSLSKFTIDWGKGKTSAE